MLPSIYACLCIEAYMESNLCKNDLTWLTNNLDVFCRGILIATSFVRSHSYHENIDELSAHYESDHPTGSGNRDILPNEEGKFPCEFCDKSFSHNYDVYNHQRKAHD